MRPPPKQSCWLWLLEMFSFFGRASLVSSVWAPPQSVKQVVAPFLTYLTMTVCVWPQDQRHFLWRASPHPIAGHFSFPSPISTGIPVIGSALFSHPLLAPQPYVLPVLVAKHHPDFWMDFSASLQGSFVCQF